jgi:hypothetical protein
MSLKKVVDPSRCADLRTPFCKAQLHTARCYLNEKKSLRLLAAYYRAWKFAIG